LEYTEPHINMKRQLLSLALFAPFLAMAQIPNGGFEQWSPSGSGFNDPNGWVTGNLTTWSLATTLSCEQGTPGAVGSYYAKITTRNVTGIGTLPGLVISGTVDNPGFPYTQRPAALNGKHQYNIPAGDLGSITVSFSKWDGSQTQAVGGAFLSITPGTQSSWSNFSAPIIWYTTDYPDTATVTILSSTGAPVAGSTIWVDDLAFGASTNIDEQAAAPTFSVAMAPGTGRLVISADASMSMTELIDARGRIQTSATVNGLRGELDVHGLADGLYVARVRFADGSLTSRPFMKR